MAKDTHTARHNDAEILSAIEGRGHRDALLVLDGDCGADDAARAQQMVQLIRLAVRARRRAHTVDGNMHSAVEAVVAGFSADHSDEHFPAVRDPSEQWHLLVGIHATFERHNDDHTQYFTGVVLDADWDPRGPRLRLVLTCRALARQAGDTVTITACRWLSDPTPASVAATASRHTHCPAGRPLYDPVDVPDAVLATKADLALRRQQPATLQPPVASLRRTNGVTELYAIVDAEEIPSNSQDLWMKIF